MIKTPHAADKLTAGLEQLGYPAAIGGPLLAFANILIQENERTNLIAAGSDLDEIITAHVLDSLAPLAGRRVGGHILDVGSGAGFPALPIAIAFNDAHVVAIEPRAKRGQFLQAAIGQLCLSNAIVVKTTAETAGRTQWREKSEAVTIRAVGAPTTNLELGLPLLAIGGRLLIYIGRQTEPSGHELEIADMLGGSLVEASQVVVPYLERVRHAWWFEKKRATPATYPRRSKRPSKQPL